MGVRMRDAPGRPSPNPNSNQVLQRARGRPGPERARGAARRGAVGVVRAGIHACVVDEGRRVCEEPVAPSGSSRAIDRAGGRQVKRANDVSSLVDHCLPPHMPATCTSFLA